eukprot:jgi/Tetstr1/427366/TSEL_017530.t1
MFAHSADSDAESDEMGVLDPVTIAQIVAEEEETANDLSRRLCSILLLGAPYLQWGDPDDDFDPMDYFVVPEDGGGRRQGGRRGTARGPLEVARRPYQEASEDGSREEKRQRDFYNGPFECVNQRTTGRHVPVVLNTAQHVVAVRWSQHNRGA